MLNIGSRPLPAAAPALEQQAAPIPDTPIQAVGPEPDASTSDDAEHRAKPRQRVLKAAKIVMSDWMAIDCVVRDISDTGARLKVGGAAQLPHKFKLVMIAENTIRDVQVAWYLADSVGVAFIGEPKRASLRKF
jgi:two-component system cell cycle response regulator